MVTIPLDGKNGNEIGTDFSNWQGAEDSLLFYSNNITKLHLRFGGRESLKFRAWLRLESQDSTTYILPERPRITHHQQELFFAGRQIPRHQRYSPNAKPPALCTVRAGLMLLLTS